MLLFTAGNSTVKVRIYSQPPAKLPADIAARNGLRVLTIPVERLNDTVARLKRLGFEVTDVKQAGTTRWALARNADDTTFELVETQPGAPRELEIGLVVPDLAKARDFFTGIYGAKELPETTSRVLPGEKELRFTTGATVFKCWAPKGERDSDTGKIPEVLGFRYVTHNVRDTQALHDALTANGVEVAAPLASHQGVASLFMVRGPGGTLLEFVGPAAGASGGWVTGRTAAQQIPQQMQDMFKRLDRNGDGKLSPQELPNAERFKQMDANGDGFVTLEEAAKSFSGGGAARGQSRPVTGKEPELHPPADRAFLNFKFATDYFAGRQPADSALAKATEANALVPHDGKLYCVTSYMPPSGKLPEINPKVLVKESVSSGWEVDLEAGSDFMRLSFMKSVSFTTDGRGNRLPKPVSVLISGTGTWRSQKDTGVVVFSRNDSTGKWTRSVLSANRWNREKTNHSTDVRCIWDHVD
jgi:catechol 2,3-dioxygenase-like lactoylglutathione lyase family enzyme